VDEAALMEFAQSRGNTDGQPQEASHIHRRAQEPVKCLATRILEHQHGPSAIVRELQRLHRPRPVQLTL
jgi:hypothetical protein